MAGSGLPVSMLVIWLRKHVFPGSQMLLISRRRLNPNAARKLISPVVKYGPFFGKGVCSPYQEIIDDKDLQWFMKIISVKSYEDVYLIFDAQKDISIIGDSLLQVDTGKGDQYPFSHDSIINCENVLSFELPMEDVDPIRVLTGDDLRRSLNHVDVKLNDLFTSKSELKRCLHFLAIKKNFQFRIVRSCMRRFEARCMNQPCSWKLSASSGFASQIWSVRSLCDLHSCSLQVLMNEHRQANPVTISEYVSQWFSDGSICGMKPKEIINHMRFNHGVHVSYRNAWRAREISLSKVHGSNADSYALLPSLSYMLPKTNPGSVTKLVAEDGRMKYFFFALHASIEAWRHCRPVLSVDGTFLKNKYGGTLLVASALDGNNQILPISFAIVDFENDESWPWFFEVLKSTLSLGSVVSIISDRHRSILIAVEKVLPDAQHGICMYHLTANLISRFKKKSLAQLFIRCAKSYNAMECQKFLTIIDGIGPGVKEYLLQIGIHRWSCAYFSGLRYNIMTTNTSESFNSRIREARGLPVIGLILEIRNIFQEWFCKRRGAAAAMGTVLTTWADMQMQDELVHARCFMVKCVDVAMFEVVEDILTQIVDLNKRICSCRKWQIEQLPCSHVLAVVKQMNASPIKFSSAYYTKETLMKTYESIVCPLGNSVDWDIPLDVRTTIIKPPNVRRPAGQPRSRRFIAQNERTSRTRCGRCGAIGHNRKSCRNAIG